MIILKNDGTPFGAKHTARFAAEKKKIKKYTVIKVEGGFGIDDGIPESTVVSAVQPKPEPVITPNITPPIRVEKAPEKRTLPDELPKNNVDIEEDYEEQDYPRASFTGTLVKPKVTYIPEECKNPAFTYKFLLVESFQHGDMCDNWQTDKEVIRNMRRNPKYKHLVSPSDTVLRRGKYNELILCRMPMEYKESWIKERRERNNAALGKVKDNANDVHSVPNGA